MTELQQDRVIAALQEILQTDREDRS